MTKMAKMSNESHVQKLAYQLKSESKKRVILTNALLAHCWHEDENLTTWLAGHTETTGHQSRATGQGARKLALTTVFKFKSL